MVFTEAAPDGYTKRIIAVNGQMPGPLIWSEEGDRLIITVTNNLYTEGLSSLPCLSHLLFVVVG